MLGMILWKTGEGRKVDLGEQRVLHVRFACARVERSEKTPERALKRRIRTAVKQLRKLGVSSLVLPENFSFSTSVEELGIQTVSTVPLQQMLAADWAGAALWQREIFGACVRIAVAADELSGEVVRTVTELCLRYRYVLLDVPEGGERLAVYLRREYGVALQLHPTQEQADGAEAAVLFAPRQKWKQENPVCLRLYQERSLPGLILPPALSEQLPAGVNRGMLLAALQRAGALKPGWVTVERSTGGNQASPVRNLQESFLFSPNCRP